MSVIEEAEKDLNRHIVWINEETRIASFHAMSGYVVHDFNDHESFMNYIYALQERSFRFQ